MQLQCVYIYSSCGKLWCSLQDKPFMIETDEWSLNLLEILGICSFKSGLIRLWVGLCTVFSETQMIIYNNVRQRQFCILLSTKIISSHICHHLNFIEHSAEFNSKADEPTLISAWPHLQVVYKSPDLQSSVAMFYCSKVCPVVSVIT